MINKYMDQPFLQKLQSIGVLPGEDRALLLKLGRDVRTLEPRHSIIRAGDRPNHVHLMIDGWACRDQVLDDGARQITAFMMPGDFCDTHMTLLAEMDHDINTLTEAQVAYIPRDVMIELTDRPAIAKAMWWASLVDEAVLRAWIVNLGRRHALERIAHLICELHARLMNVGMVGSGRFELPLTQTVLAVALGLTNIHVNLVLRTLREDGLVMSDNGRVVVVDIAALQALAGFDANYLHLRPRKATNEIGQTAGPVLADA